MKQIWSRIVWGLFLVTLGIFGLLQTLGIAPGLADTTWAALLGGAGLVFLIGYLVSDWREWPALIPAVVCGDLALALILAEAGARGETVGGLFLLVMSLPFWLAFLVAPRASWWGLIPGWVMASIGGILLAIPIIGDTWLPPAIIFAIGLPFLAIYLFQREQWWALIPGSIMGGIGLLLVFEQTLSGDMFGSLSVLAVALPFWIIFLARREQWWAVIPAGIMTTAFLVTALALSDGLGERMEALLSAIFFAGVALTFGLLWALRGRVPTEWARFPAVIAGAIAVVALIAGSVSQIVWGAALILLGAWLVLRRPGPQVS